MSGTYAQLPRLKISTAGFLERFHPTHRRGDSTEEILMNATPLDKSFPSPTSPTEAAALGPVAGDKSGRRWLGAFRSRPTQSTYDDPSSPSLTPRQSVWTPSAKWFRALISGFVLLTAIPLVIIMILQWHAFSETGSHISRTGLWGNWLLAPQAIASEFILLGAAYHSIRTRNMVFVAAVLMFNIYLVIAGFLEAAQRQPDLTSYSDQNGHQISKLLIVNRLLWTVPGIDVCFHLGCDFAAFRLYRELGWLAYRKSSADLNLGKLYRRVLILRSLTFFTVIFTLIELYTSMVLTLAAFPIALRNWPSIARHPEAVAGINFAAVLLVLCWTVGLFPLLRGIRNESKMLLKISLAIQAISYAGLFAAGVLTVRIIRFVSRTADRESDRSFAQASSNQWKTIFQFSVTTSLILAHIIFSVIVMRGFGKGLKERVDATVERDPALPAEKLDLLD